MFVERPLSHWYVITPEPLATVVLFKAPGVSPEQIVVVVVPIVPGVVIIFSINVNEAIDEHTVPPTVLTSTRIISLLFNDVINVGTGVNVLEVPF